MEQGWDPDVKKYFIKVLNSISMGLLWLMAMVTAGLYFGLAYSAEGRPVIYTIIFYIMLVATLLLLILYYYRTWKK
ncbi:MAG TPA: hypothetical protein VF487_04435 [Chitinophagaceae bacterium]